MTVRQDVESSRWARLAGEVRTGWQICEYQADGREICGEIRGPARFEGGTFRVTVVWTFGDRKAEGIFRASLGSRTLRESEGSAVIGSTDRLWWIWSESPA